MIREILHYNRFLLHFMNNIYIYIYINFAILTVCEFK